MSTTVTDQISGIRISEAVKAPCKAVALSNITLSGLQTLNGVTTAEGDRVLVTAQTDGTENGIYNASTGTWNRAKDFDGNDDVVQGTRVLVVVGGNQVTDYEVTTANPITIGTTSIAFQQRYGANATYDITSAETSASVTPTNYFYLPGWSQRQGITNDSSTDHTSAFQALLDGSAGSVPVHVYKTQASGYIKLTGRVTAPANTHIILHDGVELRWTATTATGSTFLGSATRPGIEVTGDNFRLEGYGILTGPSSATFVSNECGVFAKGTNTSTRKNGFYVSKDIEIKNWGAYGILGQFVDRIRIDGPVIHDCGHAGILFASCNRGRIRRCEIYNITPGDTNSETYPISLTLDATNYNLDANAATNGRLAANPFCEDWDIAYNTIYDCPLWEGIDAHGGYEVHIHHNNIYNCKTGIAFASGSGDAANYGGEKNSICFNNITPRKRDGSATTVSGTLGYGIVFNGGATILQRGIKIIGNDIDGYGDTTQASFSIRCVYNAGVVIAENTIRNWAGVCIYTSNSDGAIANNLFGSVSNATNAYCIRLDDPSRVFTVTGNELELNGGTAPVNGLRITSISVRHIIENNNFDAATVPYVGLDQALSGAGAIDLITKTTHLTTTGANALTLADGSDGMVKEIIMVGDGGDGTLTPTNLRQYTTITFNDVGDSVTLKFTSGKWQVMSNQGCTLA